MNKISNISFGKVNTNNIKTSENKNKKHKRAAKVAVAGATIVGGVVLYKNRNSKPILKFRNFVKDSVFAPLKDKSVPVKKRISNIFENLKTGVQNLKNKNNKTNNFADTVEIKNKQNIVSDDKKVQQPIKDDIKNKADNILQENNANAEIEKKVEKPVKADVKESEQKPFIQKETTQKAKKISKPKSKSVAENNSHKDSGKLKKSTAASNNKPNIQNDNNANKGEAAKKTGENPIIESAKKHAHDLRVAAGTAAVVSGAAATSAVINDVTQEKKKDFSITSNGKEFGGRLEKGVAFDENNNPLNGTLTVLYGSGKKVLIDYKDGLLKQSVIFKDAEDSIPEVMRIYNEGKVSEKYDKLKPNPLKGDKAFSADKVSIFGAASMLNSSVKILDGDGKHFIQSDFIKNKDKDGKIIGKPIFKKSIETQELEDGATIKSISVPYKGENKVIRTIKKDTDGSMEITLLSPESSKEIGALLTDSDKKITSYWHFADGNGDDAVFEIEDGKITSPGSIFNADLLSDSTSSAKRYKTQDGSVIQFSIDDDNNICSIANYRNDAVDEAPEVEILLKDGKAASEIYNDRQTGENICRLNHKN